MKVYICYTSYQYEGCSDPLFAATTRTMAQEWLESEKPGGDGQHIIELELHEEQP